MYKGHALHAQRHSATCTQDMHYMHKGTPPHVQRTCTTCTKALHNIYEGHVLHVQRHSACPVLRLWSCACTPSCTPSTDGGDGEAAPAPPPSLTGLPLRASRPKDGVGANEVRAMVGGVRTGARVGVGTGVGAGRVGLCEGVGWVVGGLGGGWVGLRV